MSASNDNGGPAFPVSDDARRALKWDELPGTGMTLRDWFAGQALVGMLANGSMTKFSATRTAYELADAMLTARKEKKP